MMPMGYGYGGPVVIPPPMPMPMPMPVPMPVGIPVPYTESTTTTTTTEANEHPIPIGIPIPVPHFVQIALPSFVPQHCIPGKQNGKENRNKNCPPCPPCSCNPCTPSFFSFCSPCHQECRCKNGKQNPIPQPPNPPQPIPGPAFPMPIPMPAPPPVVIVPFPPKFPPHPRPPHPQDSDCDSRPTSSSCSGESRSHDSCESGQSRRKKKRKKSKSRNKKRKPNYDIYRRNFGEFMKNNRDDSGLVEPVLSYMSKNGDIKMRRRLTNNEASALLGEREPHYIREPYNRAEETYSNKVRLTSGEDFSSRHRIVVKSKPGMRNSHHHRQVVLDGKAQHLLGDGRKELVFKTPENKKISNLSVSFQISN